MMLALLVELSSVSSAASTHICSANNVSRFGLMGCAGASDAAGHKCCRLNQQDYAPTRAATCARGAATTA